MNNNKNLIDNKYYQTLILCYNNKDKDFEKWRCEYLFDNIDQINNRCNEIKEKYPKTIFKKYTIGSKLF